MLGVILSEFSTEIELFEHLFACPGFFYGSHKCRLNNGPYLNSFAYCHGVYREANSQGKGHFQYENKLTQ